MRKPLVYVAGPYTNPDPVENTNKFANIGLRLVQDGVVTPFIPHFSLVWHLVTPQPYEFWLEYDLEIVEHCDAVLRIPGASSGADGEVNFAKDHGIPVYYNIGDLYAWAAPLGG